MQPRRIQNGLEQEEGQKKGQNLDLLETWSRTWTRTFLSQSPAEEGLVINTRHKPCIV